MRRRTSCFVRMLVGCMLLSCSHSPNTPESELPRFSGSYLNAVSAVTKSGHAYHGVNNLYQVRVTMLTSSLVARQIDQRKNLYGWDNQKMEEESAKARQLASTETRFFLSFFSPEGSHSNLTDKTSLWRFLLQTGTQRVVGEAKAIRTPLADIQSEYPDHDRFSLPYMIHFPVPLSAVEAGDVTFIMTGPLGNEEFVFQNSR